MAAARAVARAQSQLSDIEVARLMREERDVSLSEEVMRIERRVTALHKGGGSGGSGGGGGQGVAWQLPVFAARAAVARQDLVSWGRDDRRRMMEALRARGYDSVQAAWEAINGLDVKALTQLCRKLLHEHMRQDGDPSEELPLFEWLFILEQALTGVWALCGRHIPLERIRPAFCLAAGFRYLQLSQDQSTDALQEARAAAADVFAFLAFVPSPLLLWPAEPGWVSSDCASRVAPLPTPPPPPPQQQPSSSEALEAAAGPSHARVEAAAASQRALAMVLHSLALYDRCPLVADALAEAMARLEVAEAVAEKAAAAAAPDGGGGGGHESGPREADVEAAWCAVRKTVQSLAAVAEAATAEWRQRRGSREGSEEELQWFDATAGAELAGQRGRSASPAGPACAYAATGAAGRHSGSGGSGGSGDEDFLDAASDDEAASGPLGMCLLAPGDHPAQAVEALRQVLACCRWYRGPATAPTSAGKVAAAAAAALPPPAPTRLVVAGAEQMLLAALVLREASAGPDPAPFTWLTFEPYTSEELAREVLGRERQLFPPAAGEAGVVALDLIQLAHLPHSTNPKFATQYDWNKILATGSFRVTATSSWSTQFKQMEEALVGKRLGALWFYMVGAEGVQRGLLMAAKVRDALLAAHGTTLFCVVTEVTWPKAEEDAPPTRRKEAAPAGSGPPPPPPPEDLGAAAHDAAREVVGFLRDGQTKADCAELAGLPLDPEWQEWRGAAGWLGTLRQELFAPGSRLGSEVRLELRLTECEPGRPDAPRLPLQASLTKKQRLKQMLLATE
ncbi:hypothetical protein GPECTOR_76g782 [Gonium pectorale]|uniref:Uncharacterized protein n=1 Tax=Gonium pectorale TaxID=33097 RepID=A0A150G2C3_GONPE|nr:hypothetical protein GPECTOR_76g782 [Gonium pectorale]|eukprot:KXZ43961.1 hypothetical protein GPECTOR_76g782 [Gonium pectorale]